MLGPELVQLSLVGGLLKSVSTPVAIGLYHRVVTIFSHTNLSCNYSSHAISAGGARNADIFTRKLQEKTEKELEDLVEQRNAIETNDESRREIKQSVKKELWGPKGPEPTRYGDWERAGRCSDF